MDRDRRTDALGLLILSLLLHAATPRPSDAPAGAAPERPTALSAAEQVRLGWPIAADCADPDAWEALPGIGPALGTRLADAARRGALQRPDDLLRVDGIGTKMASALEPRVQFTPAVAPEVAR